MLFSMALAKYHEWILPGVVKADFMTRSILFPMAARLILKDEQ